MKKLIDIDCTKFLLILAVVLIHSNIIPYIAEQNISGANLLGFNLISLISPHLLDKTAVPTFFLISGYLLFRNVTRFTARIYFDKLRRRVKTLLVPYIIWNVICLAVFLIKVIFANCNGAGIIENGQVNWGRLLAGFWCIPSVPGTPTVFPQGYPYAFAFWFIRDLMVFVLLSPAVRLICRNKLVLIITISILVCFNIGPYGFIWFLTGAFIAKNGNLYQIFIKRISKSLFIGITVIYFVMGIFYDSFHNLDFELVINLYDFTLTCVGIVLFLKLGAMLSKFHNNPAVRLGIASTFGIYAIHQVFSTTIRTAICRYASLDTTIQVLVVYLLVFSLQVSISFTIWLVLRKMSPRLLSILTGER